MKTSAFMRFFCSCGIASLLCLFCACSKTEPPKIPSVRSDTLLEIFRLVELKKYREALPLIERYQSMDSTNPFLGELHSTIVTNACIIDSERLAREGKLQEACSMLENAIVKYGQLPGLVETRTIYQELVEMKQHMNELNTPCTSEVLLSHAKWITQFGRKYQNDTLINYAKQHINNSSVRRSIEQDRAAFLIYADAMDSLAAGDFSTALALTAFLAAEKRFPYHLQRIQDGGLFHAAYRESMNKQ